MKTLVLTFCCLFCITVGQNLSCDRAQAQEVQRKAIKSPAANSVPRTTRAKNNPRHHGHNNIHRGHNHMGVGRPHVYPYHYRTYRSPVIRYYYGHPVFIYPQPSRFPGPFFYFRW